MLTNFIGKKRSVVHNWIVSYVLKDIYQKNLVKNTPSLEIARCLMFDLIGTILKTINELEKTEDSNFIEKMKPANELIKCKTFLEMKEKMLKIIKSTCEYISNRNKDTDFMVRDMVIETITSDFMDPNLAIASIAEKVGKYPYYVSKIFKTTI